jgi:signal transduction histidine kinase/response regulator RpfG family c-di-GMP phosphodiesterase
VGIMQTDPPKVNILMVDDNESNLLALETILQGEDRTLVRAGSGEEALQFLLYNDAAVILLDVRMPGISGLETAELIRGRKKTQDVPIIFLTAYDSADKDDLSKGYFLGAVDYIIKPLDPEALKSKVAVFVELYKKNEQVKHQAELLHEKNIQLENANFQRLGKLVDLGQRLGAERDPDTLIQIFCDSARDILGAEKAFVRLIEPDGEVRYVTGFAADVESTSDSETTGIDDQTLTAFSSNLNAVRVPNSQFARSGKVFRSNPSLNSLLSAPISQVEHTIGWLYAIDKQDADEFSEADERLAMTLAGQLAVAYENARLYEEAREHASVLQDEVAERKRAQEEKEKLLLSEKAARLEAEAAQRLSSQLLMREEEARADAEAANRLKDEFLATVSHELRTPLNSILGWSQLMRSGKLDDEAEGRALTTIERNTRALAQIIDDLLDVSRIISGKLRLDVGPIELEPVVAAALDTIKPASDAKNIDLNVSLDSSTGTILGDPNRLQQVVWNLLTNAIKFTPRGGRVEVKLERVESSARITVSDTGEGISEDFLPYIFDRFRQADSTFTRLHGGLGLGLAIVRHLVEMHGGSVSADSPGKGKGARFSVSFPVSAGTWGSRSTPREVTEWRPTTQEDFELAGLTVLVVDDDFDARELLVAMLRERGAEVIPVSSSFEALNQLASRTNGYFPDVLVSDIGMPEEDGLELITKVRSMEPEQGGRIPAIALTAYAREEDRERVLDAGFHRHLAKPVDPPILAAAIADLARYAAKARG